MKLKFCAVCGIETDLHQHHIEPVVWKKIGRERKKGYDSNKKLKECTSMEVFAWLFDQGVISDHGEITVCSYHHSILHGIVKFQKAEHNKLIREGQRKAKEKGIKLGRPRKLTNEDEVLEYVKTNGIKQTAKQFNIGVGTVYRIMGESPEELVRNLPPPPKRQPFVGPPRPVVWKKLGRPPAEISEGSVLHIKSLRDQGVGIKKIAASCGIGIGTLYKILAEIESGKRFVDDHQLSK